MMVRRTFLCPNPSLITWLQCRVTTLFGSPIDINITDCHDDGSLESSTEFRVMTIALIFIFLRVFPFIYHIHYVFIFQF